MHNLLWGGRLCKTPVFMMRFSLSQLSITCPPKCSDIQWIDSLHTPGLRSAYISTRSSKEGPPRALLWAFGGAFLSGDVAGNLGWAEKYGRMLDCDVFVVDMRLCPENKVQDAVYDLYLGYEWLLRRVAPENVMMLGISSGAGSLVRVLQLARGPDAARREYFGRGRAPPPALPQPAGAVLLGPFVDYVNVKANMTENAKFDWVVTQGVLELVDELQPLMGGGMDKLELCSPLHQSLRGLCPLLVSVSQHECLYEENTRLVARAKADGVDAELSTTPYMCHVFQLFSFFLPEAAAEERRIVAWVKSKGGAWS